MSGRETRLTAIVLDEATIASTHTLSNHRSAEPIDKGEPFSTQMLESGQRVTVDLSGLTIKGVSFSGNVKKALGTIVQQVSPEPPVYLVELLFSFKGIRRVEVPVERIHPA